MTRIGKVQPLTIGAWSILSGSLSIASLLDFGNEAGFASRWFALVPAIALYGAMIASGIFILRGRWLGVWLLVLSQLPQLPVVSSGSFAYALMPAPSLELDLFPLTGFRFTTWGQFVIEWNADDLPFQASVSAGAVFLFIWAVNELGKYPTAKAG